MTINLPDMQHIYRQLLDVGNAIPGKIRRGALAKAARVYVKSIKAQVPPRYREARKAFGYRVRTKDGTFKVGAAVGIKHTRIDAAAEKQAEQRRGRAGVGLSAANIHWAILGTGLRFRGRKTRRNRRTGKIVRIVRTANRRRYTGKMPAILAGVVQRGVAAAHEDAQQKAADALDEGLERELAKSRAKGF